MNLKPGQYHYQLRGRSYRIFRCDSVTPTGYISSPADGEKEYQFREDARARVYQLNGWNLHK